MTTAVTEEETVSAEGEVGIVTMAVMAVAHMGAVTATVEGMVVDGMAAVEGRTVAVTEMAEAHLVAMMDLEEATAMVGTTEDRMAEGVAALEIGVVVEAVVEIRMEVVATLEAEAVMDRLVGAMMKCNLNQTQYSFKVFPIKSQNKSSLNISAPLV